MDEKRLVYGQDEYIPMVYEEPTYSDTATAADVREGTTVHINGQEVAGELPDVEQATPTISFDSGTITATAEQAAGYVDAGTKSATMELTPIVHAAPTVTLSGKTITATVDYGEGWSTEETKVTTIEQAVQTMPAPEIIVQDSGVINVNVPALHGYYAQNSNGYVKYQDVVSVPTPSIAFDAQSGEVTAENTQARGYTKGGTASSVLSLPVASLAAPTIAIDGPNITATVEQGAGYIGGGVASASAVMPTVSQPVPTISVSANGVITAAEMLAQGWTNAELRQATEQLPTIASATITPTKSTQHAISAGYYAIGAVDVAPIPSEYIIPSGMVEITNNGVVDVRAYKSASVNVNIFDILASTHYSTTAEITISYVNDYAFAGNNTIKTLIAENVEAVGFGVFSGMRLLEQATLPKLTRIANSAFYYCSAMTTIDAPLITDIGASAFARCYALSSISFPNLQAVSDSAFYLCSNLSTISIEQCVGVSNNGFYSCSALNRAYLPNAINLGWQAFQGCAVLSEVVLSAVAVMNSRVFFQCSNLTSVNLVGVSRVPTISAACFGLTPIMSGSGSIYVPQSLYSQFTTAQYWSEYSSAMVAV